MKRPSGYYPAFLDLKGKDCVVVGGGDVAERKTISLLKAGAKVKVISPELTKRLERRKERGEISHIRRRFRSGDLTGAFLVIAATDNEEENKNIAKHRGLVNVVDRPEMSSFIVPSLMESGPLMIAVSTSGASPAMARAIRKDIEKSYSQFGLYIKRLSRLRKKIIKEVSSPSARRELLMSLASDKVLRALKKGLMPDLKGILASKPGKG